MQVLRASEVHVTGDARIFHYSRVRAVALAIVLAGCGVACFIFGTKAMVGVERYVSYYVGSMLLLALLLCRAYITARFGPGNWLVQTCPTGLFIKFRSYLNAALPDSDLTVVFLPYQEIRSAAPLSQSTAAMDAQGERTTRTVQYVQLDVTGDVSGLSAALSNERTQAGARRAHWYGTTTTLYSHYPVRVLAPSIVQVEWGVVPGVKAFLNTLRPFVRIADATFTTEDFSQLKMLGPEQQRDRLRELDASGQTVLAIVTARRLYGYDLAAAKDFIEGLRR